MHIDGKDTLVTRQQTTGISLDGSDGRGDKAIGARLTEIRGRRTRDGDGAEHQTHRDTSEGYEKGTRPIPKHFLQTVIEKNPGWSFTWLTTGRLPKREGGSATAPVAGEPAAQYVVGTPLDDLLLAEVMHEVEAAFGKHYQRVSVEKRAALIAAVYDDARARGKVSRDTVLRLVKLTGYP